MRNRCEPPCRPRLRTTRHARSAVHGYGVAQRFDHEPRRRNRWPAAPRHATVCRAARSSAAAIDWSRGLCGPRKASRHARSVRARWPGVRQTMRPERHPRASTWRSFAKRTSRRIARQPRLMPLIRSLFMGRGCFLKSARGLQFRTAYLMTPTAFRNAAASCANFSVNAPYWRVRDEARDQGFGVVDLLEVGVRQHERNRRSPRS